jgi:hypothetical protein
MRDAFVTGEAALRERLERSDQAPAPTAPPAPMPPYMESFLAHLRLLVGVPFPYLVPDARLLPPESIRFFYLDRSWVDRLVDGALAVGKVGTREQAHHHQAGPPLQQTLDLSERMVRPLQRRLAGFQEAKAAVEADRQPAQVVTGLLLRSGLVSGWPHLEVRALAGTTPLRTLRLERLAPAVLLALFEGLPTRVELEEPHHGVQFGLTTDLQGRVMVTVRQADGQAIKDEQDVPRLRPVPLRVGGRRVVAAAELRRALHADRAGDPRRPRQTGSGNLAVALLNPPWRQRFEGGDGEAPTAARDAGFVPVRLVARQAAGLEAQVASLLEEEG